MPSETTSRFRTIAGIDRLLYLVDWCGPLHSSFQQSNQRPKSVGDESLEASRVSLLIRVSQTGTRGDKMRVFGCSSHHGSSSTGKLAALEPVNRSSSLTCECHQYWSSTPRWAPKWKTRCSTSGLRVSTVILQPAHPCIHYL